MGDGLTQELKQIFNYKTVLCSFWMQQGSCHRGNACTFAHGEEDLAANPDDGGGRSQAAKQLFNYKTVLCKEWSSLGRCPRGDSCTFAHGEEELALQGEVMRTMEMMESGVSDG